MENSLKLIIVFLKNEITIDKVKEGGKQFFDNYHKENDLKCKVTIKDFKSIDVDLIYKAEVCELDVYLEYSDCEKDFHPGNEFKKIGKSWCNAKKNNLSHLWLRLASRSALQNKGKEYHSDVYIKEIAFGTLPTMHHFIQHYHYANFSHKPEIMSTFLHSQRFLVLYVCQLSHHRCSNQGLTQKCVVYYKSISRVLINDVSTSGKEAVELFFVLKNFPFLYNEKYKGRPADNSRGVEKGQGLYSEQDYQDKKWERSLDFGCACNKSFVAVHNIGRCPVLKVVFPKKHRAYGIIERLIQRCAANTFFFYSSVETTLLKENLKDFENFFCNNELFNNLLDKNKVRDVEFASQYAWEVIIGFSLEVKDQIILNNKSRNGNTQRNYWEIRKNILKNCANRNIEALTSTLYHISEFVTRKDIFNFEEAFDKLFKYYSSHPQKLDVPEGMCFVRRLIITPSRTICLPPSEHFDNRIIREFGSEHLLRVSIQDDNFSKLTFAVQYHTSKDLFMSRVAKYMLNHKIHIGPRSYEVLAASNSQLREHGLWMHSKDHNGNSAADIRKWMGDFSHIKNVAKYMARMGQCFSSSEEAVQIELSEDEVEKALDVKTADEMFTFSDGIGMISEGLAEDVRKGLEARLPTARLPSDDYMEKIYKPTAFQIRFKGCKGMVAVNPNLEGRKLVIRPSMEKFSCDNSNFLEVVKISAPRGMFLNRPLISILEQLGVPANVFLKLQKKMVLDLTDSLIYEKKAWKMMSNLTSLDYPYRKLLKSGICLTQEPFFRSLLLSVYKVAIDLLRSKSRIAIPAEYGRNMLGVLDEHKVLKYGEVFVQYSEELGNVTSPTHILEGTVVVTKNPCMHPGDVRKLKAVNVDINSPLRLIKDCIVFPADGNRPHPDEMAGSDLDGDEYVVMWLPDLVFPTENYPPMMYPANPEIVHSGSIQVPDMIDFLCKYIQNDNIGVLANAHLAWADYLPNGIFSKVCMQIAQKYPQVLDFAKSGTTCYLKPEEKPKLYPDFMEKGASSNSYKSNKALGLLYRVTRNLEACVSKIDPQNQSVTVDKAFEYSNWEHYKESAEYHRRQYTKRVKNILKKYGLRNETEALTGFAGKMNDYSENRHERENALQIVRTYILDAIKRFRMEFYKAHDEECRHHNVSYKQMPDKKFARASAWYMVTYQSEDKSVLSFPWILHDILCEIRDKNLRQGSVTIPESSFIESSDKVLLERLPYYESYLEGRCYCVLVLYNTVKDWMTNSSMNLTMSADYTFCYTCYHRLLDYFQEHVTRNSCCSFKKKKCECAMSCSPTKLIIEFMKFYATEVREELCSCTASRDGSLCNGFKEQNLQSIALRTYASLAVTRNTHYIGLNESPENVEDGVCEEGDPIRVSVSKEFEKLLTDHNDDLVMQLKALSKVKDMFITPEKDGRGNWYILVHSIGIDWQRYSLEEFMMDTDIVRVLKSKLHLR